MLSRVRLMMLLRTRGIVSFAVSGFIRMTAARTGAPLGASLVFGTAHVARVFGTAPDLDAVFLAPRTARVFGTALDLDAVFLAPRTAPACSGA
jgi:hypothetical protein